MSRGCANIQIKSGALSPALTMPSSSMMEQHRTLDRGTQLVYLIMGIRHITLQTHIDTPNIPDVRNLFHSGTDTYSGPY